MVVIYLEKKEEDTVDVESYISQQIDIDSLKEMYLGHVYLDTTNDWEPTFVKVVDFVKDGKYIEAVIEEMSIYYHQYGKHSSVHYRDGRIGINDFLTSLCTTHYNLTPDMYIDYVITHLSEGYP